MENKKNFGAIGLVVICLAISALFGIAYAAFTKTLSVSGSATVSSSSWNIGWKSMSQVSGGVTINDIPSIQTDGSTASISGWSATIAKPGDSISFDVTVKNYGSYNAKLTDVKYGSTSILSAITAGTQSDLIGSNKLITCSATVSDDATNVCNNLTLSVVNQSASTPAALGTSNAKTLTTGCAANSDANCTETYRITLTYSQDQNDTAGTTLPSGNVTVTFGQMDFIYTQQN